LKSEAVQKRLRQTAHRESAASSSGNVNVARRGETVLHFTAARGGIEHEEERTRFAALLLDRGARFDMRDELLKSAPLGGRAAGAGRN